MSVSWNDIRRYISQLSDDEIQDQLCDLSEFNIAYRKHLLQELESRKTRSHSASRDSSMSRVFCPHVTLMEDGDIKHTDEQRDNCAACGNDSGSLRCSTVLARILALVEALYQGKSNDDVSSIEAVDKRLCAIDKNEKNEKIIQKRKELVEKLMRGEIVQTDSDKSKDTTKVRTDIQASEAEPSVANLEDIIVPHGFID